MQDTPAAPPDPEPVLSSFELSAAIDEGYRLWGNSIGGSEEFDIGRAVERAVLAKLATQAAQPAEVPPAVVPASRSSKSDAQIARELQASMDALLEPEDPDDKIKYRTLIRIMARARNRLEQLAAAAPAAPAVQPAMGNLLNAGAALSNSAFNLAQRNPGQFTARDIESLDRCRRDWDDARREWFAALSAAVPPVPAPAQEGEPLGGFLAAVKELAPALLAQGEPIATEAKVATTVDGAPTAWVATCPHCHAALHLLAAATPPVPVAPMGLTDAARTALEWYADEAESLARHLDSGAHSQAVLASLTVLALDRGRRARAALAAAPTPPAQQEKPE